MSTAAPKLSVIVLLLLGCGSAPPDLDEAFRRIQVHEATIANREAAIEACNGAAACAAADEACAAGDEICAIAVAIDDRDAHARCRLARRRCPRSAAR
jgi:hypothetical protein